MTPSPHPTDPFEIVAQALGRPRASLTNESAMYRDHGWDSFGHVSVILALERAYGVRIDDAEIKLYTTMRAIVKLHQRVVSGGGAS